MSTTVVISGLNYYIPAVGDNNWGQNVTDAVVALATAASSNASVFNRVTVSSSPITVVSGRTYLVDTSAARTLNLPSPANNAYLYVRDSTGTAATHNITIHRFGSETIDGVSADKTLALNNGWWGFLSDGTNWYSVTPPWPLPYSFVTLTGSVVNADIATGAAIAYSKLALSASIVNADIATGAAIAYAKLALSASIVNADVASGAAIAVNKLAAVTISKALVSDASGFVSASTVTATELGYLSGVTSAIQTQLTAISTVANAALPLAGGTLTGALNINIGAANTEQTIFLQDAATNRWKISGQTATGTTDTFQVFSSRFNARAIAVTATASNMSVQIRGTTTNDNAASGDVGEYIESVTTSTSVAATATYGDLTSISLGAGDWDITGAIDYFQNSATWTGVLVGISTTSGNSGTGQTLGKNQLQIFFSASTTATHLSLSIPRYRLSLSGTTTVYLKMYAEYTAGTPKAQGGSITARRIR